MAILVIVHPCLRRLYDALLPFQESTSSPNARAKRDEKSPYDTTATDLADKRQERRTTFDYYFALIFLAALHGFSVIKILAILAINYSIATRLPRSKIPAATWVFNIAILFANELLQGYRFADIARLLTSGLENGKEKALVSWGQWLDSYGGLIPRWEILFKVTVLRLISFNLDYYWSLDYRAGSPIEVCHLRPPWSYLLPY